MRYFLLLVFLAGCTAAATQNRTLNVGDGQVDGHRIEPYEFTWRQCAASDGQWADTGELTEQVAAIGSHVLRLRHIAPQQSGATTIATTYFDRASFAPLRMEFEARLPDGGHRDLSMHELDDAGYRGWSALTGEKQDVAGSINSKMLSGALMGLPLATLSYQKAPLEFMASMMNFDATYRVIATWNGTEILEHDGNKIEAWLIDVEWHHLESGDVYPAGPEASGGRYWVVPEPPAGFPYVPRYKTDTYAVEFVPGACR